ncbi:MAG TPA: hypothetical protein VIK37_00770 [Candidatus Saccharimonadales bacterium]
MDEEKKDQPQQPSAEQPEESPPPKATVMSKSYWRRLRNWYLFNRKWTIPATAVLILLLLVAVPWTRYKAAGIVVKKNFTVEVLDSTSRTPVSDATVRVGSLSSHTDGNGRATLRLSAGNHAVLISKKYYKERQANVLVPILSQKSTPAIEVEATGRQAKIVVKNLITQKPLGDVDIKVADINAKTDKDGEAVVVLPVGTDEQKATLGLKGYNDSAVTIEVSSLEVIENNFALTPAGKVYFLSKRTGKLDLMKANLDGTEAKVVLAGTGSERDYDTALLPSPNWKYVALVARRSTAYPTPQLYVLSTAEDKLLDVDNGDVDVSLVGWSGDNLIYTISRRDLPEWQTGKDKLKSYDAGSGKSTLLDQISATGDAAASAYEYYAFTMVSGENVVYSKSWFPSDEAMADELLNAKKSSLSIILSSGQGYKPVATFDARDNIQYSRHSPSAVYIWQQAGDAANFFNYTVGSSAPKSIAINEESFYDSYRIFYLSPSGKKSLWAESRDGKYTIFVADANGLNPATIASLTQYNAHSWFNDEYILTTRKDSELHIMNAGGGEPVKITDFQPTTYSGY